MRTILRKLNFVRKKMEKSNDTKDCILFSFFAEDFLSRFTGYFSKFLQNARKFSMIFQDAGKFYKIFHAGSLVFPFYQKLACPLFMCLQNFTAYSSREVGETYLESDFKVENVEAGFPEGKRNSCYSGRVSC